MELFSRKPTQVAPLPRSPASSSASATLSVPNRPMIRPPSARCADPLHQAGDLGALIQPNLGEVVEQRAVPAGLGGVHVAPEPVTRRSL